MPALPRPCNAGKTKHQKAADEPSLTLLIPRESPYI